MRDARPDPAVAVLGEIAWSFLKCTDTAGPGIGVARWDGTSWSRFVTGPIHEGVARAVAMRANGALLVGGYFPTAGGEVSANLALLSPTCPALATPYGTGCSGAGPLVITADTLPWLGSLFRTTTTGIPANSLCLGVIGFTQLSIPLATLLPEGQPGCTLLASPDIVVVLAPGPGTAHSALALPSVASLLGGTFFQQTIPVDFDAAATLTAVRGSNALALTIGTS